MTSSSLYICIDCELTDASALPTLLNEHSLCPRCGSSSVVPVDTLLELNAKANAAKQAPPSTTSDYAERAKAMRAQRLRDAAPLIEWLKAQYTATSLSQALSEWDGWAWHSFHPWEEDNPTPGYYVIELIQGVKHGPRWLIKIDATLVDVSQFQDGMN